ncbi:MAG: hypothetical protein R3C56_04630 [Pirellulaceae bacterium]
MAKYETSWGEYNLFMSMYKLLKVLQSQGLRQISDDNRVDAITALPNSTTRRSPTNSVKTPICPQ